MKIAAGEGFVNHYGAVRLRATGSASLKLRFTSLDEVRGSVLVPLTLSVTTNIELTRISNFTEQRSQLEIKTTEMDEFFSVSKVTIFTKPTAEAYPA